MTTVEKIAILEKFRALPSVSVMKGAVTLTDSLEKTDDDVSMTIPYQIHVFSSRISGLCFICLFALFT